MNESTKALWDISLQLAQFLATVVLQLAQLLAVVVGGVWVYLRFRREGPNHPRIEFGIDCTFLGPQQGFFVAAFVVNAHNKGYVEHRFTELRMKALGIKAGEALTDWKGHAPRLCFPEVIFRGVNLVPQEFGYFFVRPGVDQSFSFVTRVSQDIRFIVARATFKYQKTGDLHTVERVFEVKPARTDPANAPPMSG